MTRSIVNAALTSNGTGRVIENDTYAAFVRRVLAAHGRRIAAGDVGGLADLAGLATTIDHALTIAVTGLRACGYSWADIAAPLGITRQAAQQRWGNTDTSTERTV